MAKRDTSSASFADLISMFVTQVGELPTDKGIPSSEGKLFKNNVIPAKNPVKRINPILTSVESARVYNTGTVLAKAFYDFNQKKKEDVKQSTLIAQSKSKLQPTANKKQEPAREKSGIGFLAAAALGTVALATLVYKYLGPIGEFISKFVVKLPSVLKSFSTLKEFLKTKLLTIFDGFKATKVGKMFSSVAGKLKSGIFGEMLSGISKTIGKRVAFIFKTIPIFGALMNFTFAYLRWKEGKYVTSILELLSGIFNLSALGGFVIGPAISLVIDGVILLSDLLDSGDQAAKTSGVVHGSKLGAKALVKTLAKTAGKVGVKLAKVLKFVPFIGGIAGLALAYMRFKDGDWGAGIVEVVAAIADFIPGGSVISWILDGGLLLYDILRTNKKSETPVKSENNISFADIASSMGDKIAEYIWYVPGISSLLYLGRGIKKLADGNYKDGLADLSSALIAVAGGKGLVDLLSYTFGFFDSNQQPGNTTEITNKTASLSDTINSSISSYIGSLQGIYTNIVDSMSNITTAGSGVLSKQSAQIADSIKSNESNGLKLLDNSASQISELISNNQVVLEKNITMPTINTEVPGLADQNKMIAAQNQLLIQLLTTSKEQLNVTKKQKNVAPAPVTNDNTNANINAGAGFSTSRKDGRSMYNTSPYSISPIFA